MRASKIKLEISLLLPDSPIQGKDFKKPPFFPQKKWTYPFCTRELQVEESTSIFLRNP